jgi:hypothetical protein
MRLLISCFISIAGAAALLVSGSEMAAADASVGNDRVDSPPKPPLQLNDAQRNLVVQSVKGRDTTDKPPASFNPVVGAEILSQEQLPMEKMPIHQVPPPAIYEVPELKNYGYAQLPDRILLIDPMMRKVAYVIPHASEGRPIERPQ